MAGTPDDLARFIEGERSALRAALPGKLAAIEAAWSAGDFASVARQAHTIHGSAGTFGFHGVSRAAAALEESLEPATSAQPAGGMPPEARALAALDALCAAVRELG